MRASAYLGLMTLVAMCMLWPTACRSAEKEDVYYTPVKQTIEGWTVWVDPLLLDGDGQAVGDLALPALRHHLQKIAMVMAEDHLKQLKTIQIRIELNNPRLSSMQYHPSRGWLTQNKHDPALEKQVHIPRAAELYSRSQLHKHPWVVLHELAHAYHHQILSFEHADIKAAYEGAVKRKNYEAVLLFNGRTVRHYGLTNHKEYFAEGTEAYFGKNDFYPFVGAELQQHDPVLFDLMQELWGKRP